MLAKLSKKGQITVPAEIRRKLKVECGEYIRFLVHDSKIYLVGAQVGIESLRGKVKVKGPQNFKTARRQAMEIRSHEKTIRSRR